MANLSLFEHQPVKNYLRKTKLIKRLTPQRFGAIIASLYKNPFEIISKLVSKSFLKFILSDKLYLRWEYRGETGLRLNFKSPKRFNEKTQVLKLQDETLNYTMYADKYEVRKFIATSIGVKYLIPLIKIYDYLEEIDFSDLPNEFVLKCTHDSGTVIICRDKTQLDIPETCKVLREALSRNYYFEHREYQYKNIQPRIICQEFLSTLDGNVPSDFKIFCFHGVPTYIEVDTDRFERHSRVIYDTQWIKAPFGIKFVNNDLTVPKPDNLHEMLSISARLARGFKFVRVDLFVVRNKIYFGELTFHHGAGYEKFYPDEYDFELGELIKL